MGRHHLVSSRQRLLSKVAGVTALFCVLAPFPATLARAATPPVPAPGTASTETTVSIPFDPAVHGFGFANWADLGVADDASVSVVRRLFGDASVCVGVSTSACAPYPSVTSFVTRLNQALVAGRCEGMAVAAFARFRSATPGTSTLARDAVIDEINYWSSTQILPAARAATKESRALKLNDLVARLASSLRNGGGDVLGLTTSGQSHSVLPISIRQKGTTVSIGVYDSNHPRTTQQIEIDLGTGTWTYRPRTSSGKVAVDWMGKAGTLSLVPFASRAPVPTNNFRSAA